MVKMIQIMIRFDSIRKNKIMYLIIIYSILIFFSRCSSPFLSAPYCFIDRRSVINQSILIRSTMKTNQRNEID